MFHTGWMTDFTDRAAELFSEWSVPVLKAAAIAVVALLALKGVNHFLRLMVEHLTPFAQRSTARGKQRVDTLSRTFKYGSTVVIFTVTILMILGSFGIDLKALLATVGIAGVAIGFGAQSLVKDVVAGVFILIEDQFAVGDVIEIGGENGVVEQMTLRITQLRNTEGTLITVPNGSIGTVKNMTSEWSRVDYKVRVSYRTDIDRAIAALSEEAKKLKADMPALIIEEPEMLGVDELGESSIILRLLIKTEPLQQWTVNREFNKRVMARFDRDGIEIPLPQRTIWLKECRAEKSGQ